MELSNIFSSPPERIAIQVDDQGTVYMTDFSLLFEIHEGDRVYLYENFDVDSLHDALTFDSRTNMATIHLDYFHPDMWGYIERAIELKGETS